MGKIDEQEWERVLRAVEVAEAAGTGVTLTHAQARALLDTVDALVSESRSYREDADIWRGQVEGMHAELDALAIPRDVSAGGDLMCVLPLLERFRRFFQAAQFGVPSSLLASYLKERVNLDER